MDAFPKLLILQREAVAKTKNQITLLNLESTLPIFIALHLPNWFSLGGGLTTLKSSPIILSLTNALQGTDHFKNQF